MSDSWVCGRGCRFVYMCLYVCVWCLCARACAAYNRYAYNKRAPACIKRFDGSIQPVASLSVPPVSLQKEERDQARFQEAEAQAEVVKEQSATAVEEGMALARQKMLAQQQEQLLQSSLPSPQGSTSFPAQLDSNVDSPSPTTNSSSNGNSSSSSSSSSSNSSSSNSNRSMNDEDAPPPNGMSPSSSSSSEPAAQSVAQDQEGSTPPELTSSEAQAGQDQPSPTGSSSGGGSSSRALTNEEINAARTMRMQGEAPRGEAQGAAGSASASAAALQVWGKSRTQDRCRLKNEFFRSANRDNVLSQLRDRN